MAYQFFNNYAAIHVSNQRLPNVNAHVNLQYNGVALVQADHGAYQLQLSLVVLTLAQCDVILNQCVMSGLLLMAEKPAILQRARRVQAGVDDVDMIAADVDVLQLDENDGPAPMQL